MVKRRRKPPQPQARPSARELWEEQQASIRRLVESPFFRSLQDANRQLPKSPLGRQMIARMQEDGRRWREWQERNSRALDTPPEPTAPSVKRRRKGGGRTPSLSNAEIARLQAAYLAMCDEQMKQPDKFDALRKELGRYVSDSTLRRHVLSK
jgi:hypothetical protein